MVIPPILAATPVFYSANFGGEEPRRPIRCLQAGTTVLFTDTNDRPDGWDHVVHVPYIGLATTPRIAARYLKLMPHRLFPDASYTVWFDATHDPVVDLSCMAGVLKDSPLACFAHPRRTTAAQEIEACVTYSLLTRSTADEIYQWFKRVRFQDDYGLYGTACVATRNCVETQALNEIWWWGCNKWPPRDQIFLPWALSMLGITPQCLQGKPRDERAARGVACRPNPYFDVTLW